MGMLLDERGDTQANKYLFLFQSSCFSIDLQDLQGGKAKDSTALLWMCLGKGFR
jgi:hypothetical protein